MPNIVLLPSALLGLSILCIKQLLANLTSQSHLLMGRGLLLHPLIELHVNSLLVVVMAYYELSNVQLSGRNACGLIELIEPGCPGIGGHDLVLTILKPVANLLYGHCRYVVHHLAAMLCTYLIGFYHYLSLLLFFFG